MKKRIDYFYPRLAYNLTGIVFVVQIITELVATRTPGFEWVLPATGAAFAASLLWVLWVGYREKNT